MSVIIKGDKWNWADGASVYREVKADIELIEPTSEEVAKLKEGDTVLIGIKIVKGFTPGCENTPYYPKVTIKDIVAILPSPEPQRGLPERLTENAKYQDLINAINTTNDYLKDKEREGK